MTLTSDMGTYDEPDSTADQDLTDPEKELVDFVISHTDNWREWRESEYDKRWKEIERLWLGIWSEADSTRKSERSKIITPALQQAIETYSAEIEEVVFGRGQFFDLEEGTKSDPKKVEITRTKLNDAFKRDGIKSAISNIITLAAVYGTGIGEIVISDDKFLSAGTQSMGAGVSAIGTYESERFCVYLREVVPYNFLIDPTSGSIKDALGCAVEEMVSAHKVVAEQAAGTYRDVKLSSEEGEHDLAKTQDTSLTAVKEDQIKILRYYGLVPTKWLKEIDKKSDIETDPDATPLDYEDGSAMSDYEDMTEAIVVIGNGGILLKAKKNPYMMQDRPIIAYSVEKIPGSFFGRGIGQKGFNMQKAIDHQVRSHIDSVSLTAAPMMGVDASRMPRGFKFEVYPGRTVMTNGDPNSVLKPLVFGQVTDVNMNTANAFQNMLLQATGTVDSAALTNQVAGDASAGSLSITLGGIIKKNKKALLAFQDNFLMPFVKAAAYRYMQFDPENFPADEYDFIPISSMGIMAREYESQQFMAMMSTLGPQSPIVPMLLQSIVTNSSLANREALAESLEAASKPDPEAQKMEAEAKKMQLATMAAQLNVLQEQARKEGAQADLFAEQARLYEFKLREELAQDVARGMKTPDAFEQTMQIAEAQLKEYDIDVKVQGIHQKEIDSQRNLEITKLQTAAQMHNVEKQAEIKKHEVENRPKPTKA